MLVDLGNGLLVNDDDGEVIEAPEGTGDMAGLLATRAYHAGQQAKRWGAIEGAAKSALLRLQEGKTARYGDIVAQRRQASRPVFDRDRFAEWLSEAELTAAEWEALAFAAKSFEPKALSGHPDLAFRVGDCTDRVPTREFIVLDVVAEVAPGTEAAGV